MPQQARQSFHNSGPGNQAAVGSGYQINNFGDGTLVVNYEATPECNQPVLDKEACLKSLSFRGIDARLNDISLAHPDTCNWFFQTAQFEKWLQGTDISAHNGVLWVKGKPGAGKSTLMKHTLLYCQRAHGIPKDYIFVGHFFNARGDNFEKSPLGMLQSLLYQLIKGDSGILGRFITEFDEKIQQALTKQVEEEKWRVSELKNFILREIQRLQSNVLILVDALDECRDPDVRDMVGFIEELSLRAIGATGTLKICLSSRHYPNITIKKRQELVVEEHREHEEDISKYVNERLNEGDDEIEAEILRKASGVFMWVILVVAMLNKAFDKGKIDSVRKLLSDVPPDLEDLLGDILDHDKTDRDETILLLQWVLLAKWPLSPQELYFAMVAGTHSESLGMWNPSKITEESIRRRIISSSRGLVEVRNTHHRDIGTEHYIHKSVNDFSSYHEGTETVHFIHESVNDFLFRNNRLQKLDPTLTANPVAASQDRLMRCCLHISLCQSGHKFRNHGESRLVFVSTHSSNMRHLISTNTLQKPTGGLAN